MQKRYILFSLMVVSLLLFIYGCVGGGSYVPPPVPTCSDTDGGIRYDVAGVATVSLNGINTTYSDTCISGSTVGEYYCAYGASYFTTYACPSGRCVNGACTAVAPPQTCSDTDGGNNINLSGTVTITNSSGSFTFTDSCASSSIVNERYCSGNNVVTAQGFCLAGQVCSNGVCTAPQASTCTDSDGANYNTQGTVSVTNASGSYSFTDYCYGPNGVWLYEYLCSSNKTVTSIAGTLCTSGYSCSNGACVVNANSTSNVTCTDTDGGYNLYTKGTLSFSNQTQNTTLIDYCSGTQLVEYQCPSNTANYYYTYYVNCQSGYACSNGACIVSANSTNSTNVTTTCTDTDGGMNRYVAGTVTMNSSNGTLVVSSDYCTTPSNNGTYNYVQEFYCSGNNLVWANSGCQGGCSNGACNSYCSDSDGGFNPGVNGTVSYGSAAGSGYVVDSCLPPLFNYSSTYYNASYTLREYQCSGLSLTHTDVNCSDGNFSLGICDASGFAYYGGAKCI